MSSNATSQKIAVVGGGIAGLFCAYALLRRRLQLTPPIEAITLFEKAKRVGGRIRTIRLDAQTNPLGREEPARRIDCSLPAASTSSPQPALSGAPPAQENDPTLSDAP
jgi:cation diffusion facilitator CzcD-associated flavoprotein CzcO